MQRRSSFFAMEAIANLSWVLREHRAGCRLPIPSCRQSVTQRCLLKNPSKSTLVHDAVAAAVLHKHHPIIPIGAGLIQFVYDLRSRLANSGYPSEKSTSAIFRASFQNRVSCV